MPLFFEFKVVNEATISKKKTSVSKQRSAYLEAEMVMMRHIVKLKAVYTHITIQGDIYIERRG